MKNLPYLFGTFFLLFTACIGDDIIDDLVDENVIITSAVDTIGVDDQFQFTARYTNNVGATVAETIDWSTGDTDILTIDANGLATGITKGDTYVMAEVAVTGAAPVEDTLWVTVDEMTSEPVVQERTGMIATTSSYLLTGEFVARMDGNDLVIDIAANYAADTGLPGLYIYLTNNPGTNSGALEIGPVSVFSGAHSYRIENVGLFDYDYLLYFCKPFGVKVGDGALE